MSKIRRNSRFFVAALLMVSVLAVSTSASVTPMSQQLTVSQEAATIGGGFWCDFNDGVGVGLGVAVLFGCVWCGAGAAVAGIIHVVAC